MQGLYAFLVNVHLIRRDKNFFRNVDKVVMSVARFIQKSSNSSLALKITLLKYKCHVTAFNADKKINTF